MELWIRSQDKEKLILTNSIEYDYHKIFVNDNEFAIYDSEKRALEVLDEIQNILIDYKNMSRVVYEMPKE